MQQWSERQERDNALVVSTVVAAATSYMQAYQSWLYEEVRELNERCEDCCAKYDDPLKSIVEARMKRLTDIERYEISEAVSELRGKIKDVNGAAYDNIVDARRYLEEGVLRFESLVRECLDLRRLLDGLEV